jgi:hypothetical protein
MALEAASGEITRAGGSRMRQIFLRVFGLTCAFALLASPSFAQQSSETAAIRVEMTRLRQQLDALEARLAAIEGPSAQAAPAGQAPVPVGASGAGGPTGALPVYGMAGGAVSGAKVFNPDMAVIGDFLGAAGSNKVNPGPALEMHESEAAFQAVVDPYARADFFISFGEQGVSVEEGFITLTSLPGGLLTKVGKMRAAFGKVNTLHNHVLPWTDRPIVTNNLVGGEDGINDAGISVARLIPVPGLFLEATGQMFRGDSGANLFKTSKRGDLTYLGHLRLYQDITEGTNLDLGASYAHAHNASGIVNDVDLGRFTTGLYGVDATVRYKPLRRSIYRSFVGRTEMIWSHRQQPNGLQRAFGYYVSGDYQFARRWFAGARYDRSDHADDALMLDKGESVILTYWPSEFSQVRGQYRRTNYAVGPVANELLFQFQFSIGAHGAHPF